MTSYSGVHTNFFEIWKKVGAIIIMFETDIKPRLNYCESNKITKNKIQKSTVLNIIF